VSQQWPTEKEGNPAQVERTADHDYIKRLNRLERGSHSIRKKREGKIKGEKGGRQPFLTGKGTFARGRREGANPTYGSLCLFAEDRDRNYLGKGKKGSNCVPC